jgi:transcriptional regulator with XRE-family HTH domain
VIGARLRAARTERGLSVRELARRLEVSASLVSQIETGKARPSVKTLYAMVSELGVSLDELLAPGGSGTGSATPPPPEESATASNGAPARNGHLVQRDDDRATIQLESGVRWERLTPSDDPDVDFLLAIYEVGGSSSPTGKLIRHSGREYGLVIQGQLGVTVGFEECTLGPGDSIAFESTTPHRLHNEGPEEAHAIWVVIGRRG